MCFSGFILADNSDGKGQLFYVIALLILAGVGSLLDKLKKNREESISRRGPVQPPAAPESGRPVPPAARPTQLPPSRPVSPANRIERMPGPIKRQPQAAPAPRPAQPVVVLPIPALRPVATKPAAQAAAPAASPLSALYMPKPRVSLQSWIGTLDGQQLRRAIILSEILKPPVSLREE